MKKISVLVFFGILAATSVMAQGIVGRGVVSHKPEYVFAPSGFDSNDNAQVVLDGVYPNTCYRSASPEVSIDQESQVIRIKNRAFLEGLSWCAMTLVPYTEIIDLGSLAVGKYSVEVADDHGKRFIPMNLLSVSASRGGVQPDETLYAPVDDAFIESSPARGVTSVLVVRGKMTNTCMKLKKITVRFTPGNVIEVLPLAEWTDRSGTECAQRMVSFEKRIPLKGAPEGRSLIHVRSLNGKAINKVVDIL